MSDITLTVSAPGPTVELAADAPGAVTVTVNEGGGVSTHAGLPDLATSGHPVSAITGALSAAAAAAAYQPLDADLTAIAALSSPATSITNAVPKSLIDAAGDLLVGSAADTVARLGIGTAGQVLTVNAGATAPEWAVAASGAVSVIARTVLGSDAASVDFTSIPSTYENLIVEWVVRGTASTAWPWLYCQVNGDTTSNYGSMTLHNSGSGAATDSQATTKWYCGYTVGATGTTGFAGSGRMWLPGYARTVFNKTFFSQFSAQYGANGNTAQVGTSQGAWGSTAAISSLSFTIETASFKAGSVFTLYGIVGA